MSGSDDEWGSDDCISVQDLCPKQAIVSSENMTDMFGKNASDDNDGVGWSSDDDNSHHDTSYPSRAIVAAENKKDTFAESSQSGSRSVHHKSVSQYVAMGFEEESVIKAMKDIGEENEDAIVDAILSYSEIQRSSTQNQSCVLPSDSEDALSDYDFSDDEFFCSESKEIFCATDGTLQKLMHMGFSEAESSSAIDRCGFNASLSELADSITAAQTAKEYDDQLDEFRPSIDTFSDLYASKRRYFDGQSSGSKKRSCIDTIRQHKKPLCQESRRESAGINLIIVPNPMVGFSLPDDDSLITHRILPKSASGPPYFYYENVALTPKGVWRTISSYLYDIHPEFVDSKYFCAANRKRGYIHNLPIQNRFPLQPMQPRTIHEALPLTKKWWPSWDVRTQLNCLQTCVASAQLTDRIRKLLSDNDMPPPLIVQRGILEQCRKWNLVWVGLNKVAPLEPDEIESILGFPKNHTRGGGISRTDRYKSLGNSFQVDTVAYHLSVLKDIYPDGINVLSLFSGIGGGEVALHRLGIHMKIVVSVEISEINRNIVRGWWEQTEQTGTLIDIADVQRLSDEYLGQLVHEHGGFDLVIGGSPCNNLAGSNRVSRDGLEGQHSSLFYEYVRILTRVRSLMGRE